MPLLMALLLSRNKNDDAARQSNDLPAPGTIVLNGFVAELDATSGANTGTSKSF